MQLEANDRALISNVGSGESFGIVLVTPSFDAIKVVRLRRFEPPIYVRLELSGLNEIKGGNLKKFGNLTEKPLTESDVFFRK